MKKLAFVIFCCLPVSLFANSDSCNSPLEYTIDKRCYVTTEQKQIKPYNAVAYVLETGCSASIVKNNNQLYVYTAKHCTDIDFDKIPNQKLDVRLQDGRIFSATSTNMGHYDITNDEDKDGDWAIYLLDGDTTDVPYVNISQIFQNDTHNAEADALSVGYGNLKIMSDAEIENFKNAYINYLQEHPTEKTGFVKNGIDTNNIAVQNFLETLDMEQYIDIFSNNELKQSECKIKADGSTHYCQTWHGDSGGGVFDNSGNILRIITRGYSFIGGEQHAGKMKYVYSSGIDIYQILNQITK